MWFWAAVIAVVLLGMTTIYTEQLEYQLEECVHVSTAPARGVSR